MIVLVITLLRRPTEDVESEIRVGLGPDGCIDIGWGETRLEVLGPSFELGFEWGSSWSFEEWDFGRLGLGVFGEWAVPVIE